MPANTVDGVNKAPRYQSGHLSILTALHHCTRVFIWTYYLHCVPKSVNSLNQQFNHITSTAPPYYSSHLNLLFALSHHIKYEFSSSTSFHVKINSSHIMKYLIEDKTI